MSGPKAIIMPGHTVLYKDELYYGTRGSKNKKIATVPEFESDVEEDKSTHVQNVPSSLWICTHGLGKRHPSIVVVNSKDEEIVMFSKHYLSDSVTSLQFGKNVTGKAYFS